MAFVEATQIGRKLRMSAQGPSGSGKSTSAIRIAKGIIQREGGSIGAICSEDGRIQLEAWRLRGIDFRVNVLTDKSPDGYLRAIKEAAACGFTVLIIDSGSHEWEALLNEKDNLPDEKQFTGWGTDLNPKHHAFLRAISLYPGHVIMTLRAKTKYVIEQVTKKSGKTVSQPRAIGVEPIARPQTEFEFDVGLQFDMKSVCSNAKRPRGIFAFFDKYVQKEPGEELGRLISDALRGKIPPETSMRDALAMVAEEQPPVKPPESAISQRPAPAPKPTQAPAETPKVDAQKTVAELRAERAELKQRLDGLASFFGGKPQLLEAIARKSWPSTLGEAREVLTLATAAHELALHEQCVPFDSAEPTADEVPFDDDLAMDDEPPPWWPSEEAAQGRSDNPSAAPPDPAPPTSAAAPPLRVVSPPGEAEQRGANANQSPVEPQRDPGSDNATHTASTPPTASNRPKAAPVRMPELLQAATRAGVELVTAAREHAPDEKRPVDKWPDEMKRTLLSNLRARVTLREAREGQGGAA